MLQTQVLDDLARLARLLKLDRLAGAAAPAPDHAAAENIHDGFDFSAFRSAQMAAPPALPRLTLIVMALALLSILAGSLYFFYVLAVFKTAILANATEVLGPHPNTAVIYAVFPAFAGFWLLLLDYVRVKSGIHPYKSPVGIGVALILAILLYAISGVPGQVIKRQTNAFAAAHGYAKCSSPFDPDHLHVYALNTYIAAYGCPTAGPPQ